MCLQSTAAVTKHHRLVASTMEVRCPPVYGLPESEIQVSQGWLLPRPLSLGYGRRPLPVLTCRPSVCGCVLISSHRDTSHTGMGPPQ